MKAAVVGEHGVEIRDLPKPEPKPNEVLIRVRASSLNRADLLVSLGHQHGAVGGIGARLGLECAGEVEAVGSDVKGIKAGDRVMGSAPGGYAECAVTDAGRDRPRAAPARPAEPRRHSPLFFLLVTRRLGSSTLDRVIFDDLCNAVIAAKGEYAHLTRCLFV